MSFGAKLQDYDRPPKLTVRHSERVIRIHGVVNSFRFSSRAPIRNKPSSYLQVSTDLEIIDARELATFNRGGGSPAHAQQQL